MSSSRSIRVLFICHYHTIYTGLSRSLLINQMFPIYRSVFVPWSFSVLPTPVVCLRTCHENPTAFILSENQVEWVGFHPPVRQLSPVLARAYQPFDSKQDCLSVLNSGYNRVSLFMTHRAGTVWSWICVICSQPHLRATMKIHHLSSSHGYHLVKTCSTKIITYQDRKFWEWSDRFS